MNPSTISAGRVEAQHTGQKLARFFAEILRAKYHGPIALAGGYLRDVALGLTPKDLDIFLDAGMISGMSGAEELAGSIANRLIGATVGRAIPCYGEWAEDLSCVVKVHLPVTGNKLERLLGDGWPKGCPAPTEIDLVVLMRDRMVAEGYVPRLTNDVWNQELFLRAVIGRVDLRLNAIGATPAFTTASPQWDHDAYESRLVIQKTRDHSDEDRIGRRLKRLTSEKFLGWTTYREQEDGSLKALTLGDGNP